jgi:hypothetical protein
MPPRTSHQTVRQEADNPGRFLYSCHRALTLFAHRICHFRGSCFCATKTSGLDRTVCDDVGPGGGRRLARANERDGFANGLPKPRLGCHSMCCYEQQHGSGQAISPKFDLGRKGNVHIREGGRGPFRQLLTPCSGLQGSGPVTVCVVADQFRSHVLRESQKLLGCSLRGGPEFSAAFVIFRQRRNVYRTRRGGCQILN